MFYVHFNFMTKSWGRVLNITQKRGLDGNMTNYLKVDKRQKWVDHLFEQSCITSSNKYNAKKKKKN